MANDFELPPVALELGNATRAYQAAVDDFDREVARLLGINETDLRCLELLLQEVPAAAPGFLATRLGLTTGAVTPMLNRLEQAGFITRSADPDDRRKTVVQATTEAAQRAQALLSPLIAEATQQLLSSYSVEEIEVLIDFMRRAQELQQRHVERLRTIRTHPHDQPRTSRSAPRGSRAPSPRPDNGPGSSET